MTHLAERHRSMHRHSDEDVAAVVHAAIIALRRRVAGLGTPPGSAATAEAEMIRLVRSGVLPRRLYEATARPADPPYDELPPDRRDEDQLRWYITQALTDHAN